VGKILFFGGVVLLVLGALGGLAFVGPLITGKGGMFSNLLAVLILGVLPAGIGIVLMGVGSRRARLEAENDERGFSDTALALAKKGGGQVQVDQVCKATGLTKELATARMRTLTGRGLFELDFDANGQMVWKLSADAGKAQLAELTGRS
jgi:hypothetical protein